MTPLIHKRFIFTVTTGRSGSNFITEALACLKNVLATHEPKPRYDRVMRSVQLYPAVAKQFLLEKKLPAITKKIKSNDIYFESSHLFCKGFLEAWLALESLPVPDLICLDRDFREISLSFNRLNSIPARTINGLTYLLSPHDPTCLTTIDDIERLNDYQLCYWYCLEMEQRKEHYSDLIKQKGGRAIRTSVKQLQSLADFERFRSDMALSSFSLGGKRKFENLLKSRVNVKSKKKRSLQYSTEQLDEWEQQVQEALIVKRREVA